MGTFVRTVLFVAVISLVAAACASVGEPSSEASSTTAVTEVDTSGSEGSAGSPERSSSSGGAVSVPDVSGVCDDPLGGLADAGLVDIDAAAAVLEGSGLDADVGSLLGEPPAVGLCAVDVSATAQAVIEAVDRAWAAGDGEEARRLIEEFLAGLEAWMPPAPGVWAAGDGGGHDHVQGARDRMALAAEAASNGDEETAVSLLQEAADEFATYLEGDDAHPGAIEEAVAAGDFTRLLEMAAQAELLGLEDLASEAFAEALSIFEADFPGELEKAKDAEDLKRLLQLAAQAALLGLEDLSEEALDAAREVVKSQLEKLIESYEPCTASEEQKKEFLEKAAQAELLGVPNEIAMGLVEQTLDIERRRKAGEPVPECDAASFDTFMEAAAPGFSGGITVQMETCDGVLWQGIVDEEMGFSGEGASVTWTGGASVEVDVGEDGIGTGEFAFDQFMSAIAAGRKLSATMPQVGALTLRVDRKSNEVTGEVVIEGSVRSGTAAGKQFAVPISGKNWNFTAPLRPASGCE